MALLTIVNSSASSNVTEGMLKADAADSYTMTSSVLVYQGMSAWRFLCLPKKQGQEIKERFGARAKGWGSLPVSVTVGKTTWDTSIFPDKKIGSYLLPLKAKVRKIEAIKDDARVTCTIRLR
jgi:hypothetical protein